MKKAAKYALITGCIALFLFLMLPFLEPLTLSDVQKQSAFKPQIFTVNPLTEIVRRVARIFGKEQKPSQQVRLVRNAWANPQADEDTTFALASATAKNASFAAEADSPEAQTGEVSYTPEEENARFFLQGTDEEWLLTRQRAPETAQSGMHEISVKDNAYDRYVKQERLARFTPTARQPQKEQVPDSKLARLFNPVKRFFGIGGGTAARSGALMADGSSAPHARALSRTSDGLGKSQPKQARQLPQSKEINSAFTEASSPVITLPQLSREHSARFTDLIDTNEIIQEAADLVASSVQDPKARGRARQEQREQYTELAKTRLLADLLERGGQEPPQDALPETANCDVAKGMITQTKGLCFRPSYLEEAQELRETNAQLFLAKTGQPLRPTQLTPVLGIVDSTTIQALEPTEEDKEDPSTLYTKEIYRFMLEQGRCKANECFWVANTVQSQDEDYQTLQASVIGAGVDFGGDPLKKYEGLKNQFVADQVVQYQQKNPQATQEDIEKFAKDVQLAAPPYVLYTKQDLTTLSQQLKHPAPGRPNPTIYFTAAPDARAFFETYGFDIPAFYGAQGHELIKAGGEVTLEKRSQALITDLADNVLVRQQIHREIHQDAGRKAVTNTVEPIVEEIQEKTAQDIANMASTLDLGKIQK